MTISLQIGLAVFDRPATITDVARLAHTSVSTVSRVINGSAPVSESLRRTVLDAMKDLEFEPDLMAQSLRGKSTATIGVIIPDIRAPFFSEVVRGIQATCLQNRHAPLLCNSDGDPEKEFMYAGLLRRSRVDGIIFAGAWGWEQPDYFKSLCDQGIPLCFINREITDLLADAIVLDRTRGGYMATSHLIELGHARIGCIAHVSSGGTRPDALRGFRQAMADAGLEVPDYLVKEAGDPYMDGGYKVAIQMLVGDTPPTAIFARSDMLAIGVMAAARDSERHVPKDLAVVGFGDIPVAEYLNPPLTTIRQPQFEIGVKAATMLLERIKDRQLPPRQAMIEPQLVMRGSTIGHSVRGPGEQEWHGD